MMEDGKDLEKEAHVAKFVWAVNVVRQEGTTTRESIISLYQAAKEVAINLMGYDEVTASVSAIAMVQGLLKPVTQFYRAPMHDGSHRFIKFASNLALTTKEHLEKHFSPNGDQWKPSQIFGQLYDKFRSDKIPTDHLGRAYSAGYRLANAIIANGGTVASEEFKDLLIATRDSTSFFSRAKEFPGFIRDTGLWLSSEIQESLTNIPRLH